MSKKKSQEHSEEKSSAYAEAFQELVNLWQYMTDEKRQLANDMPDSIDEKLTKIEQGIDELTRETEQRFHELGLETMDYSKFIRENPQFFSKKDIKFLAQTEQMKREVKAAQMKIQELIEMKEKYGDDFEKVFQAHQEEKKENEKKKKKTNLIKDRQKRLKGTGFKEKWIPL